MADKTPQRRTRGSGIESSHDGTPAAGQPLGNFLESLPTFAPTRVMPSAVPASTPQPGAASARRGAAPVRPMRGRPLNDPEPIAAEPSVSPATPVMAPLAPVKASNKLEDLLTVIEELSEALAVENQALAARMPERIEAGLERKQRLGRLYHDYMMSIRRNPRQLQPLPAETKAALKAAATVLDQLAAENNRLLKIHISVVDSLLSTVVNAVRDQALTSKIYSGSGHLDPMTTEARLLAVSMNEEF